MPDRVDALTVELPEPGTVTRKSPAPRSGFTLLEILLVVLVVGITVAAFLPVALNTADQARTRSFLRQVISLNHYARSRAVLDRAPMLLQFHPDEGWVRLMRDEPPRADSGAFSGEEESSEAVILERRVPDTMRIRQLEGARRRGDLYEIRVDEDGVGASYEVEVVDPQGDIRRLRMNGFTGETDVLR